MAVRFQFPALLACTLALAACAGGHGAGGFAPLPAQQNASMAEPNAAGDVAMTYSIKIPAPKAALTSAARHAQFVSSSTQSIVFQVYKAGKPHTGGNLISTAVVALDTGAKGCTGAKARTCTGALQLPPPSVDIVATTYDLKPAGKKIPPKAKKLAIDTIANQAVRSGKKIGITLDGIPVSFTMTLPGATLVGGVPTVTIYGSGASSSRINVQALDADGNVILTDNYVNAAGKSTGIAMSETPSHSTCTTPVLQDGTGTPGPSITISSPPKNGVFFNYGTPAIATPFSTAGYCSFTVSAKFGSGPKQTGAFVLTGPQLNEYPVGPSQSSPNAIVVGPDSKLWFTDLDGNVGTIDPSSKAIATYPVAAGGGIVSYLGSLWVTADDQFLQMNTSGSVVNTYPNTTIPGPQLAVSPDGNFWFSETEKQTVAYVTPLGVATEIPLAAPSPYPVGVTAGPDGNMWFTGCVGQVMLRVNTSGSSVKSFNVPNGPSGQPYPTFLATASDGNFWFTSCPGGSISRMPVPTGNTLSPTVFKAPGQAAAGRAQIWGLAPGPNADMWFTDIADDNIDRIPLTATSSGQITAIHVSEAPQWVVTGPDGAVWFTEWTRGSGSSPKNGKIGRIVP